MLGINNVLSIIEQHCDAVTLGGAKCELVNIINSIELSIRALNHAKHAIEAMRSEMYFRKYALQRDEAKLASERSPTNPQ